MTSITRIFVWILAGSSLIACDKTNESPFYLHGIASVLNSNVSSVTLTRADTSNVVLNLSWTSPNYSTDSANQKFIVEMDSAGGDFTQEYTTTVIGSLRVSFTGREMDSIAKYLGFTPDSASSLEIRITSSYANNNDLQISNTINITVTYIPFLYAYVPGDYQEWDSTVAPAIASIQADFDSYEGYINVPAGNNYQFKIINDSDQYGDGGSGTLSNSPTAPNLLWPQGAGYYYLRCNLSTLSWSAIATTWSIIGDATPGGWGADTPLSYDSTSKHWYINNVNLTGGAFLKFRANNTWSDSNFPNGQSNMGGDVNNLSYGGTNISILESGTYNIILDLSHPQLYTTIITKL